MNSSQRLLVVWIVLVAGLMVVGATARGLPPCEVQANVRAVDSPEPPLAAPLDPADERLFARLKARIDQRVEEKLVSAMDEASGQKRGGFGSLFAQALYKAIEAALLVLLVAVLKAFLLKYGLVVLLVWVVSVALVAWPVGAIAGRRAARNRG